MDHTPKCLEGSGAGGPSPEAPRLCRVPGPSGAREKSQTPTPLQTPGAQAPAPASDGTLPPARLRRVVLLLAFACGVTVANIYYAQPLLSPIASTFGISEGSTALVVTLTQLGYALGLVLLLPLGDLLENRALASRTLLVTAAALVAAGLSPYFGMFLAASVLVGTTSVVAQILVAFGVHLAPERERGKFVGTVMSGLLLGILLARTVSSLVAAAWGWRAIYLISAVLMVALSVLLLRVLPERRPVHSGSYPKLLLSLGRLVREEPALRRRAVNQALMFGAFSCFWTSVAFELVTRHHLGQVAIGAFALVGAAAAPPAGRLSDRGHARIGSGLALVLAAGALVLACLGAGSLILLALAGVLLDFAVQSHQVFSQREIFGLRADARARVNTVFMGSVFLGGATGSGIAGVLHDGYGWTGVTLFGAALPVVGLAVWTVSTVRQRRTEAAS
ncbi:MFS transporter [Streptomyces sp. SID3212]|uniref:MFS transporter n=1 Tax=Streptomyces sp. SID3212 TaxID=2690259 RepID=UPI0019253E01|nr:MFS transporter [Streptomyces sp. SID3212]